MHVSDEARGDVTSLHILIAAPLLLATMLLLSACEQETPQEAAPVPQGATSNAAHQAKWLEADNPLTPAQWLASRGEPHARELHDTKVVGIGRDLETAHRVYRESERMIANRAVQLSDMLRESGADESASDVLSDLATIAGETDQTEGFGAVAQMYHNLRASGVSRTEALAALKQRYGARGARSE